MNIILNNLDDKVGHIFHNMAFSGMLFKSVPLCAHSDKIAFHISTNMYTIYCLINYTSNICAQRCANAQES